MFLAFERWNLCFRPPKFNFITKMSSEKYQAVFGEEMLAPESETGWRVRNNYFLGCHPLLNVFLQQELGVVFQWKWYNYLWSKWSSVHSCVKMRVRTYVSTFVQPREINQRHA